jgi:hypothetical protein
MIKVTEFSKQKIFEIVRVPSGSDSRRQQMKNSSGFFVLGV